ncbi:MAG: hypothetical protein ACXIT4_13405 [Erythrobacter sp.]
MFSYSVYHSHPSLKACESLFSFQKISSLIFIISMISRAWLAHQACLLSAGTPLFSPKLPVAWPFGVIAGFRGSARHACCLLAFGPVALIEPVSAIFAP